MEKNQERGFAEQELKKIVSELIEKMGFPSEVEVKSLTDEEKKVFVCDIKTDNSNFLIGQYGVNLQSLQHVARIIVRKKTDEVINFIIDVNSYRQEKNDSIVKMAKNLADQAVSERRAVVMRPMSSYERRVVHLELSKDDRIKTESVGERDDRRVVIKPTELV